jgi:hypothetical protein
MTWRGGYQSITEGEMSINGTVCGHILEFGFQVDYFFFFLHKLSGDKKQTTAVGPYFTIFVPILNLISELSTSDLCSDGGKTYSFEGEKIGKMEINWGRMALDDGEITRNIVKLNLSLKREVGRFRISLIGDTGSVLPESILEGTGENLLPCSFQVSYLLSRDHIERMLVGHPLQTKLIELLTTNASLEE